MADSIDVANNISGAWQLMTGKAEGLLALDLTADGFWNSFFAIAVSLPALALGWIAIAGEMASSETGGTGLIARLAVVDIGAWVLPLIGFALIARPAGLSPRFVHYVVASNWGSAIVAWMMAPAALVRLLVPGAADFAALLSLALFALTMVLTWRLTTAVIARGPAIGSAVFAGMFAASLTVLFLLQALLGISGP